MDTIHAFFCFSIANELCNGALNSSFNSVCHPVSPGYQKPPWGKRCMECYELPGWCQCGLELSDAASDASGDEPYDSDYEQEVAREDAALTQVLEEMEVYLAVSGCLSSIIG